VTRQGSGTRRPLDGFVVPPSKVAAVSYKPGETGGPGSVCLSTNEAPWPPSPEVLEAIARTARQGQLYPDPMGEPLRSALARHHGVAATSIFVSAGADGVLDGCFRAFVRPGDKVRVFNPTYPVLNLLCAVYSANSLNSTWPAKARSDEAAITFVVNPNSPTGSWISDDELMSFVTHEKGIVVVDEAYAPFAEGSVAGWVAEAPNLIVVRTFSKAYSLAGMRVGYAVCSSALAAELRAAHVPYPTSSCAIAAAHAALADQTRHQQMIALIAAERSRLSRRMTDLSWNVMPSHANFVYARPPGGRAEAAVRRLANAAVLVRYFPGLDQERLRITVSDPSANDAFLAAAALCADL
jgi:histidinol-phosphate aminotransferase